MNITQEIDTQKLEYPRLWEYKVIALDRETIESAIFETLDKKYILQESKSSKSGKYISISLSVEVESRDEMERIFNKLKNSQGIKYIL